MQWLKQKMETVAAGNQKELYLAFSAAPRYVGKNKIQLNKLDLETAELIRAGFNPSIWNAAQTARTLLILSIPNTNPKKYQKQIETLFDTADMGEQVALYASLPLLAFPELFKQRAAEGVRTNMGDVFEAIALRNPYPTDYLSEDAWNQMVLKTLFVGKPVYCIYGIEKRANSKLARMLSDYAHERWAAGRTVSPELWRAVGPYINEQNFPDFKRLFSQENELEKEAAALACYQSKYTLAQELLNSHPQLKAKIENGELTWSIIGSKQLQQNN